jgi:DNA primase
MDHELVKDEIKRRLRIEDVVSRHVVLQRAGSRLKARCPFHEEKTPSFFVNPALGLWKCFGCGASGDIFEFVMRIEGLTFAEAGERLAERVGLQWRTQPGDEAHAQRRQAMRRANDAALQFYQQLLQSPAGAEGLAYLRRRGFTDETIAAFKLGYAPDAWDSLLRHLRGQGLDPSIAFEAGLARERGSGGHYDVFRRRVMFPIMDVSERVIGFGGRTLDPEESAKYLNTADTPVFKKGHHVYALPQARAAIVREKSVILVEGYTDVLSLHQAGIENVVACLGTALTQDHLNLLSRHAEEIILAYDADAAGMNAAARNIPMMEACPAEVRVLILPAGLDPDDCVRQQGAEGFRAVLESRVSPVEYLIGRVYDQHAAQGAEGIGAATREAADILLGVQDQARLQGYVARVADRQSRGNTVLTKGFEGAIRLELDRRRLQGEGAPRYQGVSSRDRSFIAEGVAGLTAGLPPGVLSVERELLGSALQDRQMAVLLCEGLKPESFATPGHAEVFTAIREGLAHSGQPYSEQAVVEALAEGAPGREAAVELALLPGLPVAQEEFVVGLRKLAAYAASGRQLFSYEVGADPEAPVPEPVEDFEALRRRVVEKINSGQFDPDDPDIRAYQAQNARYRVGNSTQV